MLSDEERKFRERASRTYARTVDRQGEEMYDALCEELMQFMEPEAAVLELACDTGQLTLPLAGSVKSWTASDSSPKLIKRLQKRASAAKVPAEFAVEDPGRLTYADASFDMVLIANALHIMSHPVKVLSEIGRVLRPDGLLIAPTFVYEGEVNDFKLWLMEFGGYKIYHKWTLDAYADFLETNGFTPVRLTMIGGGLLPECVAFCRKEEEV